MSIALSSSSSFFSLSLLATLVPVDSVLKSSILIVQRLALHQNGVEFRQQFNDSIRTSLSAPYDNVRCRARLRTFIFFFFNLSPTSCRAVGVTDLEAVKGAAECTGICYTTNRHPGRIRLI